MSKIEKILEAVKFIKTYNIKNATLTREGTIDVYDDLNLSNKELSEIPVKIRNVLGDFDCSNNQLTSLENAPDFVTGDFNCSDNKLTSLDDKSLYVGGNFYGYGNSLLKHRAKNTSVKSDRIKNIVVKGNLYLKQSETDIKKKNNAYLSSLLKKMVREKLLPRYLYKYRPLNENTKKIITNNELYFSNPSDFNDPYDCNIPMNDTILIKDLERIKNSKDNNLKDIAEIIKLPTLEPEYIKTMLRNNMNKIGICCFSTLFDSILMWSHYAEYHKGICLKFDILKDPEFFINTLTVHYSSIMPYFDFFSRNNRIFEELLQTKFADWSYESEVRIFKSKKEIQNNEQKNKRIFKFNNNALVEVIFGAESSEENIKIIKKLCEKSDKSHMKFYKMELKKGTHYGLEKKYLKDLNEVKNEI